MLASDKSDNFNRECKYFARSIKGETMIKKFSNACVQIVNRWLPDAFLFAIILSVIVYLAAMLATGLGPLAMLEAWGSDSGFWSLLGFSMQIALILVLGSAMASAPVCKKALRAVAGLAHDKKQAIVLTSFVSTLCCWLNWGFGLVIGVLLAKEIVRKVPKVDYPLLVASSYSGFVIWHAGLSGSIPLDLVAARNSAASSIRLPSRRRSCTPSISSWSPSFCSGCPF